MTNSVKGSTDRTFEITVLGRTLEHLGTQMYKRRDVAIAELVANAWDAGATRVRISVPEAKGYKPDGSVLVVEDDGAGMTPAQVDDDYLVIGRNRRTAGQRPPEGRKIMGRKGVGKLAGFGLGRTMQVETWRGGTTTSLELKSSTLKADEGKAETLVIPGTVTPTGDGEKSTSGTRITMSELKHKTPPDIDGLHQALARRFSRTVIGEMNIQINGEDLRELDLTLNLREPKDGYVSAKLEDGNEVLWWAGFSGSVLPTELQGFTVLVNGKTAQAPPYFFGVEGKASGQHGTKYLTGVIEADFLDAGDDDESDRISTDRQEVDWDDEVTAALKAWGDALTRRLLRERLAEREERVEKEVLADPDLALRLERLDKQSRDRAQQFIRMLGRAETSPERVIPLSDTIVRAFEYRQFHDYIDQLETASAEPLELERTLEFLDGWKVLESRAILEVVKGRIEVVETFFRMIANDTAETPHRTGDDSLHGLIANYPWLINPEWQVLAEEKTITRQLQEWGDTEIPANDRTRYDFLALTGAGETVVIEIKRAGHAATLDDLQQLERYVAKLGRAEAHIRGVFITSEQYAMPEDTLQDWKRRQTIDLLLWSDVHSRVAQHYEHYRDILDGQLGANFSRKAEEVANTRAILATTTFRSPEQRAKGLGPQDVDNASRVAAEQAQADEPPALESGAPPEGPRD